MTELKPCPFCGGECEMLHKLGWEKVEICYPIDEYHELHGTDCPAWRCSVCGDEFPQESNYCSNCGSRVDKEKLRTYPDI